MITSFNAQTTASGSTWAIYLDIDYTGPQATHYMVSESSSFAGAAWQFYGPTWGGSMPRYSMSGDAGGRRLYVKLRSGEGPDAPQSARAQDCVQLERVVIEGPSQDWLDAFQ